VRSAAIDLRWRRWIGFIELRAGNVCQLTACQAAERHRRGFAIRSALGGASSSNSPVADESLLLALPGGYGWAASGIVAVRAILFSTPQKIPRLESNVSMDVRVLLFAIVVSLLTAIFFGLIPAIQFSRTDLQSTS